MKSNKEEIVATFIEQLMEERSPEYNELKGNLDLLSIADVVLFLKKGDETPDKNFRKKLKGEFLNEFRKEKAVSNELERLRKDKFTRFAAGFASVLLIMANIAGLRSPHFIVDFSKMHHPTKMDITKISERKINREKVMILYNEVNCAILYWPLGQFRMLQ